MLLPKVADPFQRMTIFVNQGLYFSSHCNLPTKKHNKAHTHTRLLA